MTEYEVNGAVYVPLFEFVYLEIVLSSGDNVNYEEQVRL